MSQLLAGSALASQAIVGVEPGVATEVSGVLVTAIPAEHVSGPKTPVDWFYVEVSGFGILHTGEGYFIGAKPNLQDRRVDLFVIHYIDGIYVEEYQRLVPQSKAILPPRARP